MNNEMPETIEINGVQYRRASSYSDDSATELLRRIQGVSEQTGMNWYWVAWAIMLETATALKLTLPQPPAY